MVWQLYESELWIKTKKRKHILPFLQWTFYLSVLGACVWIALNIDVKVTVCVLQWVTASLSDDTWICLSRQNSLCQVFRKVQRIWFWYECKINYLFSRANFAITRDDRDQRPSLVSSSERQQKGRCIMSPWRAKRCKIKENMNIFCHYPTQGPCD